MATCIVELFGLVSAFFFACTQFDAKLVAACQTQARKSVHLGDTPDSKNYVFCTLQDASASYTHAFTAIKDLAVTLRGALSMKTSDSFRAVYCWQTVRCLELWARVLAEHGPTTVRACRPHQCDM